MSAKKQRDRKKDKPPKKADAQVSVSSLALFQVVVLQEKDGSEPFTEWLNALRDQEAKQRILARLLVVRRGSLGVFEPVGRGVYELKIDHGPGYRLYFGRKGRNLVVLIVGGDKRNQTADIARAQNLWCEYQDEIENT